MSRKPALYPFGMKIASRAKQLQDRKAKAEEYGRNDAFSNRHASYTFDLPLAPEFRSQNPDWEKSHPHKVPCDVPGSEMTRQHLDMALHGV